MKTIEKPGWLYRTLAHPIFYRAFQSAVGASRSERWLLQAVLRPSTGMTIVDIGCGPGRLRPKLPGEIAYYGFDPNESYIADAKRNHPSENTHFFAGDITQFMSLFGDQLRGTVDLITCLGVLHHLSDEETDRILEASRSLLSPNGRFAGIEPAFLRVQAPFSRFLVSLDRGDNVRTDVAWQELLESHFPEVKTQVLTGLLRIPYTHVAFEAGLSPLVSAV